MSRARTVAPFIVDFCARSDVGRVRERNEDALEVRSEPGWAVLADGMGGYRGGDVASRVAVAAVLRSLERDAAVGRTTEIASLLPALAAAAQHANAEILRAALAQPALAGMGSTLVIAAFVPGHVVSAHVGDSRLYRLRGRALARLTRDHSMLQEQIDSGIITAEDAARLGFKGLLTRGLGVLATVEPELGVHDAHPGDTFLLCSDGLTDLVDDDDIAAVLAADAALEARAERLVELANRNGGRDNITVILARCRTA